MKTSLTGCWQHFCHHKVSFSFSFRSELTSILQADSFKPLSPDIDIKSPSSSSVDTSASEMPSWFSHSHSVLISVNQANVPARTMIVRRLKSPLWAHSTRKLDHYCSLDTTVCCQNDDKNHSFYTRQSADRWQHHSLLNHWPCQCSIIINTELCLQTVLYNWHSPVCSAWGEEDIPQCSPQPASQETKGRGD